MLGKLIKHEFRATGRIMLPMLLILLLLTVLANASFILLDHVGNAFLSMLLGLLVAAYFIGLFALGVITLVIMVDRFYKNILGDEGYLMMTLPTNVHAIVWSKLIVSLVWFLVTALAIMLTLTVTGINIAGLNFVNGFVDMPSMSEIITAICRETGFTPMGLVGMGIEFAVIVIICILCTCLHFYAAMSLGHIFSSRKVLMSVVFFVAITIAIQIISTAAAVATGIGMEGFYAYDMPFRFFAYMLHFMLGMAIIQSAIMYFITTFTMKKGLNLA